MSHKEAPIDGIAAELAERTYQPNFTAKKIAPGIILYTDSSGDFEESYVKSNDRIAARVTVDYGDGFTVTKWQVDTEKNTPDLILGEGHKRTYLRGDNEEDNHVLP